MNKQMSKSILLKPLKKTISKILGLLKYKHPYMPGFWERTRIENYPRKEVFSSCLLNKEILISDSKWYLPTLREIWENEIYKFESSNRSPYIIDCGANIGLSVIYWKHLFPESKVVAFEPDPNIFQMLNKNIKTFNYHDVETRQMAVWTSETELSFRPDNSVGGKLEIGISRKNCITVKTFRLSDLLSQKVDMLKIDIEGAEYDVLMDCADNLHFVDRLFVEYHGELRKTQKLHQLLALFQNCGFRYHIKEANPVKHPFIHTELNTYFDLQLNIYAFRGL